MPNHKSNPNPLIIIPVYQLGVAAKKMIDETSEYVSKSNILVIDDGSVDDTETYVSKTGVKLISHHTNLGKGAAIRSGFAFFLDNEEFDSVITIDGDLQHPPEKIPQMIELLEQGYDFVMGNRMSDLSNMPPQRRLSNTLSSWGISVVLKKKLSDTQCGFRAIKRWIIERLDLQSKKYAIESEVALQAGFMKAKFGELKIPTIYNENPSHMEPFSATFKISKLIFSYFLRSRFGNIKNGNGRGNE